MAVQLVMKNTFWELEMTPEELESTVQQRRQRAYTDMCFRCSSSFDFDLASPTNESSLSTDLGSPTSSALRSSPASSGGSVAGDASDRWADICDSDCEEIPPSPPSRLETPSLPPTSLLPPASVPLETQIAVAKGKAKERAAVEAKTAGAKKAPKVEKQKSSCIPSERTTLVLHKLAKTTTRDALLEILDTAGLKGLYDFVYLPMDFKKGKVFGYAIVNFVDNQSAEQANSHFGVNIDWSESHQGLDELIHRYRDSPVMHPSMPETSKPIMFSNGLVAPFPSPTKEIEPLSKN